MVHLDRCLDDELASSGRTPHPATRDSGLLVGIRDDISVRAPTSARKASTRFDPYDPVVLLGTTAAMVILETTSRTTKHGTVCKGESFGPRNMKSKCTSGMIF